MTTLIFIIGIFLGWIISKMAEKIGGVFYIGKDEDGSYISQIHFAADDIDWILKQKKLTFYIRTDNNRNA